MKGRLPAALLLAATATPRFRYERPVEPAAGAPETCAVLPLEVLEHAAPGLADLRLMAAGHEIAYRLRMSTEALAEQSKAQTILNLGERGGGPAEDRVVSFDVEMTEPRYREVLLRLARSQFSVLVRVFGINRPGQPGVALPQFVYSANASEGEPQQRRIPLPESSFRYLHFEVRTLALDPVRPEDIAGVEVLTEKAEPPRFMIVAAAKPPVQQQKTTVYEFAVPANMPLEQLRFRSSDPRAVFSRTARLERYPSALPNTPKSAENSTAEAPVQSEFALLTQQKRQQDPRAERDRTVELTEMPAAALASTVRLTIENGDDAPLLLDAAVLEMRERQICFLANASPPYTLRYGDPTLAPPRYDLSPIEESAPNAGTGSLGAQRALLAVATKTRLPFTERHPVLLWVALLAVVGTLGVVALRSARR